MTEVSGGERSLLNLWQNLDRDRFKPYLICPGAGRFSREAERLNIPVTFFAVPKLKFSNLSAVGKSLSFLKRYVRENDIDIIHSYTPRNNILSVAVGKITGAHIVWHERNLIYGKEKDLGRRFFFLPERIICNSVAVAERFRSANGIPDKVRVILNGVDLDRFHPRIEGEQIKREFNIKKNRKVVGMVANLGQRKNPKYFINAIAKIIQQFPDVIFMLVGEEYSRESGEYKEELEKMLEGLGLKEQVIFTGFRDDIPQVLASFDVFVLTTILEACSRAILEAMAMAKPIVALDSGGNPELIENGVTGILTEPEDINNFAKAIEDLLTDDKKRIEMGRKARAGAERLFDVKRNARETECIYLELVEKV